MHLPALLLFALLAVACFADGRADATQAAARAVVTTPEPFEATFALCDAEPAATGSLLEIKEHVGLTRQNLRGRKSRGTPIFDKEMSKKMKTVKNQLCKKVQVKVMGEKGKSVVSYEYDGKFFGRTTRKKFVDDISRISFSASDGGEKMTIYFDDDENPWEFHDSGASGVTFADLIKALKNSGLKASKIKAPNATNATSVGGSENVTAGAAPAKSPPADQFRPDPVPKVGDGTSFKIGEMVERRDFYNEWGRGFVTSVTPLEVTVSAVDPNTKGHAWDQVRKHNKRKSGSDDDAGNATAAGGFSSDKAEKEREIHAELNEWAPKENDKTPETWHQ